MAAPLLGGLSGCDDCVRHPSIDLVERVWRGASARMPDAAWGESDRLTVFATDAELAAAWAWFDLEAAAGEAAPALEVNELAVLYRTEFSGSCLDHSVIAGFFAWWEYPDDAKLDEFGVRIVRRDVCEACAEEVGGFYELWLVNGGSFKIVKGLPDKPIKATPKPCYLSGPCYASPD